MWIRSLPLHPPPPRKKNNNNNNNKREGPLDVFLGEDMEKLIWPTTTLKEKNLKLVSCVDAGFINKISLLSRAGLQHLTDWAIR